MELLTLAAAEEEELLALAQLLIEKLAAQAGQVSSSSD
jgi:hypothetical protein